MEHCLLCSAPLVGRTDKRFCDDACRSGYHNKKDREQNGMILHINKILKRNRKILYEFYAKNLLIVPLKKLIEKGFLTPYCTSIEVINKRKRIWYSYEIGYRETSRKCVEIVKQEVEIAAIPL